MGGIHLIAKFETQNRFAINEHNVKKIDQLHCVIKYKCLVNCKIWPLLCIILNGPPTSHFQHKICFGQSMTKDTTIPQNKIFEPTKREKQKHKQISETLKENITTIILQNDSQ